jgi:hypothetical protein
MDHSKFKTLEENLKGDTLVEHLITDFEILNQFKAIKIGLPVMTYVFYPLRDLNEKNKNTYMSSWVAI